jgi:hypothetical protein
MKQRILRKRHLGSIKFNQYGYDDIYAEKAMAAIPADVIYQHIKKYSVKNNLKKAKHRTANYLYKLMWEIIVDMAMEGDMVTLPYGGEVHIGRIRGEVNKYPDLHSGGRQYNIKLNLPLAHEYRLRMPKRRRDELARRIISGQKFMNF